MKTLQIKPPTYLLIALILMLGMHFSLPITKLILSPWNLLGLLPLTVGIVINLIADQTFHKANTTVSPFEAPSALVMQGPYRFTRNPMYLGFVLILLGVAALLGSLSPYVIVLGYGLLVDRMFIPMEEQYLAAGFGVKWETYKIHTKRWL
jgi:protein-S-isoprenylcysteine O-methyltransferase Ste14